MKIGSSIRKIRELKDVKQEYLAKKLNISLTSYGKIERNEVDVNMARLSEISVILEVSPVFLIGFDEFDPFSPSTNAIDSGYRLLIKHMNENIRILHDENARLLNLIEKLSLKICDFDHEN